MLKHGRPFDRARFVLPWQLETWGPIRISADTHNAELQKRLTRMPQVWVRLKASHSPYKHKITALHMMAWPKALHGISVVHLGEQHFKVLRSGASKALRADRVPIPTSTLHLPQSFRTLRLPNPAGRS